MENDISEISSNDVNAILDFSDSPAEPTKWTPKHQIAYQALGRAFGIPLGKPDSNGIVPGDKGISDKLRLQLSSEQKAILQSYSELYDKLSGEDETKLTPRNTKLMNRAESILTPYIVDNNTRGVADMNLEAGAEHESVYGAPELVEALYAIDSFNTVHEYEAATSKLISGDEETGEEQTSDEEAGGEETGNDHESSPEATGERK